mmetsp:Transcript_15834/g.50347  ORF Transcript_15834/g.50347 Transcript_15834/m.50347 type:complete len:227 (-) Transcript_15834:2408-3088(-)
MAVGPAIGAERVTGRGGREARRREARLQSLEGGRRREGRRPEVFLERCGRRGSVRGRGEGQHSLAAEQGLLVEWQHALRNVGGPQRRGGRHACVGEAPRLRGLRNGGEGAGWARPAVEGGRHGDGRAACGRRHALGERRRVEPGRLRRRPVGGAEGLVGAEADGAVVNDALHNHVRDGRQGAGRGRAHHRGGTRRLGPRVLGVGLAVSVGGAVQRRERSQRLGRFG